MSLSLRAKFYVLIENISRIFFQLITVKKLLLSSTSSKINTRTRVFKGIFRVIEIGELWRKYYFFGNGNERRFDENRLKIFASEVNDEIIVGEGGNSSPFSNSSIFLKYLNNDSSETRIGTYL